ncbi:MAG: hypothetical protein RBG1_1C00001G1721 [candidate division Zixibacteria bacterium RBG-1]|nr:MAG: hypothetical protein RBG1_1C00001G1721 [candidate division Zixibacteria bacterium RBG-1]
MQHKKREPLFRRPARRSSQTDNRAEWLSIFKYVGGVPLIGKGERIGSPGCIVGSIPTSPYIMASVDKWEVRAFANPHPEVRFLPLAISKSINKKKKASRPSTNGSVAIVPTVTHPLSYYIDFRVICQAKN